MTPDRFEVMEAARRKMVERDLLARGIRDTGVLKAMGRIPRERFIPGATPDEIYGDKPLAIGYGQTISQPYIVAAMTEALNVRHGQRIIEIGAGSGYQTAVLMEKGAFVYAIELVHELAVAAAELLRSLGYTRFSIRSGDGTLGWEEEAPFDGGIIAAAAETFPHRVMEQIRVGGRLVLPEGPANSDQMLRIYTRTEDGWQGDDLMGVKFVPLIQTERF